MDKKMRYTALVSAALAALTLLPSCQDKPKNPISTYADTVIDAGKRAGKIGKHQALEELKEMIRNYRATEGRYPESLTELEKSMARPIDLSRFDYNPETGEVTLKDPDAP